MAVKDKKFYWIKLKGEFMNGEAVDFLMSQKNGANYVVLYQMLILKTINTQGKLCTEIGEMIVPFNPEKIQRDCKWFDIDTIRVALELYSRLGLIYKDNDGILQIANFDEIVGNETYWAERKRLQRKEEIVGQFPINVQESVQNPLISNIYNIESNKDINNDEVGTPRVNRSKDTSFQKPLVSDIAEYCRERNNGIDPQRFFDYYEAKGWLIGKTKMKDWRAAVRTWERGSGAAAGTATRGGKIDYESEMTDKEREWLKGLDRDED